MHVASPNTAKVSENAWLGPIAFGASEMQGWRSTMEDAHVAARLRGDKDDDNDVCVFGVFDGHGGDEMALFCKAHFVDALPSLKSWSSRDIPSLLREGFLKMDEMQDKRTAEPEPMSPLEVGCAATVACIHRKNLIVANAGDSGAVLCRGGKALKLTSTHKPTLHAEMERITKAGAFVSETGRVNGSLNVSRGIGDLRFKTNFELPPDEQAITAVPDVTSTALEPTDEFCVLACDGVWDAKSPDEVVAFVRERLLRADVTLPNVLSDIVEELFDGCIARGPTATKGRDNMTGILVYLGGCCSPQ